MTARNARRINRRVGDAVGHGLAPPRPTMRLISWRPLDRGPLRGFCNIELPSGLRLIDVGLFVKDGQAWAALPTKPVLDSQHHHHAVNGKFQYAPAVEWRSRDLADRWSAAVVALVRDRHPGALDDHAERTSAAPIQPEIRL
jgi:hypothetical protein